MTKTFVTFRLRCNSKITSFFLLEFLKVEKTYSWDAAVYPQGRITAVRSGQEPPPPPPQMIQTQTPPSPSPTVKALKGQGHKYTDHPTNSNSDTHTYTEGRAITCIVTWTSPLGATLTKSQRRRQPRTLHTHPLASLYTSHTHSPLPRASPTPHLPWPPPRPFPYSPRRLFSPVGTRAVEAAGPGSAPAAVALSTRRRSGLWGRAGGPASEGRGARPGEPGPPRSPSPNGPRSGREPLASGFGGGGATL